MKKEIVVALVTAIVVVSAITFQSRLKSAPDQISQTLTTEKSVSSDSSYPVLAENLAIKVNDLSPTPSFGELGWIAHRISFVENSNYAYIEYTDTHIALKMLISYHFEDNRLKPLVLATFIPDEFGRWNIQFGKDLDEEKIRFGHYVFDGNSNQWIPEISDTNVTN